MNTDQPPSTPTPATQLNDVHAKALEINLDASVFGSFAEIGAGQEVARWFLTVGGASNTVARTISAYDKTVSDFTYGAGSRYVSRERLIAMLEGEYRLLTEELYATRGPQTRFFAFADTVATRGFKGDNDQHGWVGIRFQTQPGDQPSNLLLHVNLMDITAAQQQQALGLLGVNLIFAVFRALSSPDRFLQSLWEDLSMGRLEIDVLEFDGPAFSGQNPRAWCLQLLRRQMACAIAFDSSFTVVEPSALLRKRPLVVERGQFETVEPFHAPMLQAGLAQILGEGLTLSREPAGILEMALHPIGIMGGTIGGASGGGDPPDDTELLARIERLLPIGPVLVTDLAETYKLIPYLRRYTAEPIRMIGGISSLVKIIQSQFYEVLPGSLLEGLGRLFASDVIYYAYPMPRDVVLRALGAEANPLRLADTATHIVTADDLHPRPPVNHLYDYLRESGRIVPVKPLPSL